MFFKTAIPLSVALAALPYLTGSNAQSASSSNGAGQSSTQSGSASMPSSSGSAGGGGGGGSQGGSSELQDYLTFLNNSGYTSLSSAIQQANGTQNGQWLTELSNGNWTVFAPTNEAFGSVPQNVSNDPETLAAYLSYHYVHGDLQNGTATGGGAGGGSGGGSSGSGMPSSTGSGGGGGGGGSATESASASGFGFAHLFGRQEGGNGQHSGPQLYSGIYPNDTLGRTALNSSQFVRLEGDKDQVLAWTRFNAANNVTILNQRTGNNQNVTVGNGTAWRNLKVFEINGVLLPPGNVSTALAAVGDSAAASFGNQIQVPGPNGNNISAIQALEQARGFTLFAPSSQAFTSSLNQTLQGLQQSDPSQLLDIARNHYINGSTVYAPTLQKWAAGEQEDDGYLTSAGGQYFSFSTNSSGLFVSVGNDTSARVVQPDLLVENGVIHIIDHVLFQTSSNDEVASAAYASASEQATETSTDTQAIIFPAATGTGGSGGGGSMTSSSQSHSQSSSSQSQSQSSSASEASGSGTASTPSSFRIRRVANL